MPGAFRLAIFFATVACSAALAADTLEVIALRYRSAEQLIPVLRPLLSPGGVLSGYRNQLIVRDDPRNLAELKRVLANLDTPVRRLRISVREDTTVRSLASEATASGTLAAGGVAGGPASSVTVQIGGARGVAQGGTLQEVQGLEGSPMRIELGQAVPFAAHSPAGGRTVVYQEFTTGFDVIAQLFGDQVVLQISPHREAQSAEGAVEVQRVVTTARGRLGDWIDLGEISGGQAIEHGSLAGTVSAGRQTMHRVWVKVETLDEIRP